MKLGILLVLLACCLYLTTARPNDDALHELAELLYTDYNVSKSTMIESLEQLQHLFEIKKLNKLSNMYKQICDYVKNPQVLGNRPIRYEVDDIFEVTRHEEEFKYKPYEENFNRQLLFHGTPIQYLVSILENGLKMPQPGHVVPAFGNGIYFADTVTRSAPYSTSKNGFSLVFLCEVALGVVDIRYKYDDSKLKDHCQSIEGASRYYPHPIYVRPDGLKIPNGMLIPRNKTTDVLYNEFIVFNEAQVKIRYLVKVKTNY